MAVMDDEVIGPVHSSPAAAGPAPSQDEVVGDSSQQDADGRPGLLQSAWRTIAGVGPELWHLGGGLVHSYDEPGVGAGLERGVRDVTDKLTEYPNPEYGAPPASDQDYATIRQQNAADRAAYDKQYSGQRVPDFWRTFGNTVATAPVTVPLAGATGEIGDAILPSAARGILGVLGRTGDRVLTGTAGGATQAALTSDPSKPLGPQIGGGALTGGLLSPIAGTVSDVGSNAVRRLAGATVPFDSYTGDVSQNTINRATQADRLLGEDIPIPGSAISGDPVLQAAHTVGKYIPGSGIGAAIDNTASQFQNRAIQRVLPGAPDQLATPNFDTRAGAHVDSLYNNSVGAVNSVPSLGLGPDLDTIRSDISPGISADAQSRVSGVIDHINNAFQSGNGAITGKVYQDLTKRSGSPVGDLLNDPETNRYGRAIGTALDSRLRSQMSPDQSAMYDNANQTYRAWQNIKDARDSNGAFQPNDLYAATQAAGDKYGGTGTLDQLAQDGTTVIQPMLKGSSGAGGRAVGAGGSAGASVAIALALQKLLLPTSAADLTGTTAAIGGGAMAANRGLQALDRSSGPRAVRSALSGGGNSVLDIQRALGLLQQPVIAGVNNQQQ